MEVPGKNRHLIISILLLLVLSIPAAVSQCQKELEFKTDDNLCCEKCRAGYKLVDPCHGPNERTTCAVCPSGQFMDKPNYSRNCRSCRICKSQFFEIEVSKCQKNKDTVCRCMDGYYKSNIDTYKYQCLECPTCKENEQETKKCTPDSKTECKCKDGYYREKNKCLPCTGCTKDCLDHCPKEELSRVIPVSHSSLINVIAGVSVAVIVTLVLVVTVTHFATKRQTTRQLLSSSQFRETPQTFEELTVHCDEPLTQCLQSQEVPLSVMSLEQSNLPDCVPLEVKMAELIYSVLDLVPVLQIKQLVRSLGVSDIVIERAELDHRSTKEAHYQMLRAWAEQRSVTCPGGGQVLHLPRMQELLDKLRLMHLEQTAQELETKFNLP
ncbi:tumor necrosis factor receptor superfamily member 1A isoform X2 [Boleophthalmus pectinirostris]|nr:tumor necrosis factor receptor superfamily member 1A isoform X2 [Boleophthalmus pectinirostris]